VGSKREDVDLELLLKDPKIARRWVLDYKWDLPDPPKYIVWGVDQKIYLNEMTDEESVLAANLILRDIEIPRVKCELQYLRHTH
jgi:hypothetical protein